MNLVRHSIGGKDLQAEVGNELRMSAGVRTVARAGSSGWARVLLFAAGTLPQLCSTLLGQANPSVNSSQSAMKQHYEAAFKFQDADDLTRANAEFKLYLSMVLHRIANGRANLGDYAHAVPPYEEALRLTPGDRGLQMDYAGAALDASDWMKAKSMAASVLDDLKTTARPPDPHVVSVLAKALLELGEHEQAIEQFKLAAQLRPGFDSSSRLATAYLILRDKPNAAKIIAEMPARFGDTATLHLSLGIIYGTTQSFDESIAEFRKAIAMDDRLKGAHYSLGASYLMQLGEPGYDKADDEFRKEAAIDPNNPLVYAPLGRIALSRHKYAEAEADLKRAVQLNPQSADAYLVLGLLYREMGKVPEAETAFRKSIALTLDPSKDEYAVEKAHFWLGRLLIQSGDSAEGRKELDISQNLLYLKEQRVESRMAGKLSFQAPLEKTHEANPGELAALKTFEKQSAPLIAGSYDNLGANAANARDFANASSYFEQAAKWNPALPRIDENWGRAAIAANQYAQAEEPLTRVLVLHPDNVAVRGMLGFSLCMTHNYAKSLELLRPIEEKLDANPQLPIAYAGAMAMAGDESQGLARLKSLEEASPGAPLVHYLLGEVYAGKKDFGSSADELHIALKLDPSSSASKNALVITDLALGQKAEALQLLSDLAESEPPDGDVYYQLGRLQLELASPQAAVGSLKTAIKLNPLVAAYHQELAEAYRKNAQPEEAEREDRQSESLKAQGEFGQPSESGTSKANN